MKIEITNNQITIIQDLKTCLTCDKPMLTTHSELNQVPTITREMPTESFVFPGNCGHCSANCNVTVTCHYCQEKKQFPAQIKYELIDLPEHAEDECRSKYACTACLSEYPNQIMQDMAKADEIEVIND